MKYAAVLALLLASCGGSSETPNANNADASVLNESGADSAPPPGAYKVTFGPVNVEPGKENTQCVVKRLGNTAPLRVGQFHNVLGDASHHLIVYKVNDTEEQTTPFDCAPFTDTLDPTKGSTLMITQKKDETLTLPKGVAYTLGANQMIRLEMHFINTSPTPKAVLATSTMIPIPDVDFKDEADFLFIGTPDINLPPKMSTTIGPTHFKLPAEYADAKFFAITGHEHHHGTNVTVSTSASPTGPATSVYDVENWRWDEPATVFQDPPFSVPAGGGFNFTCEYNNTSDAEVTFGESANQEMCFFWAYYYPSKGAKVCFHTNRIGSPLDFCCPGSSYCKYLEGAL